jgi:carbonyl reductase 1
VSKVGVSALTFIQQRAFDADPREDLVVNAVHPGYVDTDMTSHMGPLTIEQGKLKLSL